MDGKILSRVKSQLLDGRSCKIVVFSLTVEDPNSLGHAKYLNFKGNYEKKLQSIVYFVNLRFPCKETIYDLRIVISL